MAKILGWLCCVSDKQFMDVLLWKCFDDKQVLF